MISEKARTIADACRFCWMCRHICPVGLVTGKESSTPRGKALMVSMDSRNIPLGFDNSEPMYQCCLCEACANDCATGYNPPVFIREARTNAYVNDLLPKHISEVIDRALTGSMNGLPEDPKVTEAIRDLPEQADVLLVLGECARTESPEMAAAAVSLLKKAGCSFTVLKEEPDCGAYLGDLIGYVEDVRIRARNFLSEVKKTGAGTVVFLDPAYAYFIIKQCGEWGILPEGTVFTTATAFFAEAVENGSLNPTVAEQGEILTLQDANRLTRGLDELETSRTILSRIVPEIREMFLNRKMAKSCGDAVLKQTNGYIVSQMGKARWGEVRSAGAGMLVTECPSDYAIMLATKPDDMKIEDLFCLLDRACQ